MTKGLKKKSYGKKSFPRKSIKKQKSFKSLRLKKFFLKDKILKNFQKIFISRHHNINDLQEFFYNKSEILRKKHFKSWDDFMISNFAFLHGFYIPFYQAGFLFQDHTKSSGIQNLISLHEYGILTTEGHGNLCNEKEKQRSYLDIQLYIYNDFYELKINELLNVLKKDSRIYINYYNGKTDEYFDNFVFYAYIHGELKFNLTLFENIRRGTNYPKQSKEQFINFRILDELKQFKKNTIYLSIVVKEYCGDLADSILLDHVKSLNFDKIYTDPFKSDDFFYPSQEFFLR